jgi:cholesterol transport system auxiliary component
MIVRLIALAPLAAALSLGGCGGLLGGGGKADLYRFGDAPAGVPVAQAQPPMSRVVLAYPGAVFQSAIGDDRILTVTGAQASYIAKTRWVSPASELFDTAEIQAIERRAPGIMLVRSGNLAHAAYLLFIDVRRFEANYANGPGRPPEIVIEAQIRLVRRSDRAMVGDWPVAHREPAGENRIGPIVAAFDRATGSVTAEIADRAGQEVARLSPG